MKFEYTLENVPRDKGGYNVPAYTEGTLIVEIEGESFVRVDGVLLVEFAIVLAKWLKQMGDDATVDLYYASMDDEEAPIFALTYDERCFRPTTVWATHPGAPVSIDDATSAARTFIARLGAELARDHQIDLPEILAQATLDAR